MFDLLDENPLAGHLLEELRERILRSMAADPHGTLRAAAGLGERCYVRACPRPAMSGLGECAWHFLERTQPDRFESHARSPTGMFGYSSPCALLVFVEVLASENPSAEPNFRRRDSRRLAAVRTRNQEAE